jgi:hypothetical protein
MVGPVETMEVDHRGIEELVHRYEPEVKERRMPKLHGDGLRLTAHGPDENEIRD